MSLFQTCGPNEAMVVSGLCHRQPKLVTGGRVFVWPWVQKVQRISLNILTVIVASPRIYTILGVPVSVSATAQIKIEGSKREMLHVACQQFLGMTERQILDVATQTLEGHQRAIMGTMTVEEIYQDRQKFSQAVYDVASQDLINMGINVVSYTISDVSDDVGYLRALGETDIAQRHRDARVGEAEASRDSGIKSARAQQLERQAQLQNEAEVAKSQRDYELKKASFDVETQTKKANADMAYELQVAKTQQKIRSEAMGIQVVERSKQIQVMEQEIARKERELEATVKRPAKAEKFRLETMAEANKNKLIWEAQAEAEAIRARGEAEAFAIRARSQAEAEAMAKKAEAWGDYKDAAMVDMLLNMLPRLAAEVAAPLAQTEKITMVAGPNGDIGAARITGEVLDIIGKLPETVTKLTGVDITKMVAARGLGSSHP